MKADLNDPVSLQVLWNRLIFIADRAYMSLGRTAFSPVVRESHDYVTVLLDAEGYSLAQCTNSIPAFIGSLPFAMKHLRRAFPAEALTPGDVLVTNDTNIGTGHRPDLLMATPIFRDRRIVAYAGNVIHLPDVGGRPLGPECADVYEEGIGIPMIKLYREGKINEDLTQVLRASVRIPDEVFGDIESAVTANHVMGQELLAFMDEYELDDVRDLAGVIHDRSEQAMLEAIRRLPNGVYDAEIQMDGYDSDVLLRASVIIQDDRVHVDYAGTSPQVPYGVNVTGQYRYAHTAFALKCLLDPDTPNNEGSFRRITDSAPEGSILNPKVPASGSTRALVGHAIPSLIFRALQDIVPYVQADSGGAPLWIVTTVMTDHNSCSRVGILFLHGGQGGRTSLDGEDTLSFPGNCTTTSVEMQERTMPLLVIEKELLPDSGGAGQFRGGLGQRVTLKNLADEAIGLHLSTGHTRHPCLGIKGGLPGRLGRVLLDGVPIFGQGKLSLAPGASLTLETPGGGGYGPPANRPLELMKRDEVYGLVSKPAVSM